MVAIDSLGLSANQWQFLSFPERYVDVINTLGRRKLVLETTRRQFLTARDILSRLNGSYGEEARRGILLADDVGLGKTAVAALVAWVVASAGERRVRILAPNDVMIRRWKDELVSHVEPLKKCAPSLDARENRVKARVKRLSAGSIQVVKHSYAARDFLACDLLIVDEAHRAKGEGTAFSTALKKQKKYARRILILTATPFSIRLDELQHMLALIGGEAARGSVRSFKGALDDLYTGNATGDPEVVAERLATKAEAAIDALSFFVIRHGIDDLPREQASLGSREDWKIAVPSAKSGELELMLRIDRAQRVAKDDPHLSKVTNDPRFSVGWRHFDDVRADLKSHVSDLDEPARAVVKTHLKVIRSLRDEVRIHSKMTAVGDVVKSTIEQGEKVILFCYHHATAQELTAHLASVLPKTTAQRTPKPSAWGKAWDNVLAPATEGHSEEKLRDTFIEWLCADLIRTQTWHWLGAASASETNLAKSLRNASGRNYRGKETIAEAAQRLYDALLLSKSSRAVLADAHPELLPGANTGSRVLGICIPSKSAKEQHLFIHNRQPDTVISIFNSPFGPDVLVMTDRLSEGIDLHRYCRHLIHYELDPSPIRTVQRNGRLRRVNSWAAVTGQPILYAYPAFRGTRDHRLVQIMKKRIDSFSLLLGGVQDFDVEDVVDEEEKWRNSVIQIAKDRIARAGGQLCAREPVQS